MTNPIHSVAELLELLGLEHVGDLVEYAYVNFDLDVEVSIVDQGSLEFYSYSTGTGMRLRFPLTLAWLHESLEDMSGQPT